MPKNAIKGIQRKFGKVAVDLQKYERRGEVVIVLLLRGARVNRTKYCG